ncbi:hypothetical protein Tco_0343290 [Tanacetum coccineum]
MFIKSQIYLDDEYVVMTHNYFLQYTQLEIPEFYDTLMQHMEFVKKSIDERALHKKEYDTRDIIKRAGYKQQIREGIDKSDDADIRPPYMYEEPMVRFAKSSILGKPVLQPHRNQSAVRQLTAFNSERPRISKPRLNDMVHNHYLEEAKKKTQERDRNSRPSVMPYARSQSTANDSKPKPRINNQNSRNWPASKSSCVTTKTVPIAEHSRNSRNFSDSKHFVCSTCQKCVFNANHNHCITKFLNEVNSRAKVPSNKKTNRNKPVEQISVANKPKRQIPKGHRFSIKKTSAVHEKTITPRSIGLSLELGIHDHSNESSSSKLVPKVVPPANKTATS